MKKYIKAALLICAAIGTIAFIVSYFLPECTEQDN